MGKILAGLLLAALIYAQYFNFDILQKKKAVGKEIKTLKQENMNYSIPDAGKELPFYTANIERLAKYIYLKSAVEGIDVGIEQPETEQMKQGDIKKETYIVIFSGPVMNSLRVIRPILSGFPVVLQKAEIGKDRVRLTVDFYGYNDRNNPA